MQHLKRQLGFDVTPRQGAVRLERVFFWLFRTPYPIIWTPIYYRNGLLAYGDREDVLKSIVRRTARVASRASLQELPPKTSGIIRKRTLKEPGFLREGLVAFYDFGGEHEAWVREWAAQRRAFTYRAPQQGLGRLLEALQEFTAGVKRAYGASPYGPLNRKATIVFLKFREEELTYLGLHPEKRRLLEELVSKGHEARLYLFLAVERADKLPGEVLRACDFTAYLGRDNRELAQRIHSAPIFSKNFGNKHIGLLWESKTPQLLREIVRLEKETEDWLLLKQEDMERQDEEWNAYLSILENERSE